MTTRVRILILFVSGVLLAAVVVFRMQMPPDPAVRSSLPDGSAAGAPAALAPPVRSSASAPAAVAGSAADPGLPGGTTGLAGDAQRPAVPGAGPVEGEGFSETARRQVEALLAEKASRTPAQQKVDSQLLYAARQARGEPPAPGVGSMVVDLDRDDRGRVLVDLETEVTASLVSGIETAGGAVVSRYAQLRAVRAWVPLAEIEALAERVEVRSIAPAARATTHVGRLTSEGDVTHRAAAGRTFAGVDGSGVKVGVLSDSVDHLEASQASGDLGPVTVLPGQGAVGKGYAGEGTAMLEIVHDLAPGAALFFATGFEGVAGFAQNIRDLRFVAGCDVIVDDIGYFNEPPFQDGIIAQAVNEVTADGALFFSSAANSGNRSDNESGTWEGDFADSGTTMLVENQPRPVHRFGTAAYDAVAAGGSSRRVDFFWADPLGGSANDYDVFVLDADGANVVASSTSTQNGTQNAYEQIGRVEVGQRLVVVKFAGETRYLHLSTGRARLTVGTAGNTRGHSCAADAFGVAAVDVKTAYPEPFTGNDKNPVETFSSDGPRRMFFEAAGAPLTPGVFTSAGGVVRQKPDIAAADGGRTTVPGFDPFFGTSAAAPHAAAIAALLKSYNPALTPSQVRAALTATALDIEEPGVDRDSGYGLVMALEALQSVSTAQPPTITGFAPPSGRVGAEVTIVGTKFTGATAVRFGGVEGGFTVDSATQVSATVPPAAATGRLTVVTPAGTATSATDFAVLREPAITDFSPAGGGAGTAVTLTGVNFTGATAVRLSNVSATFAVRSATEIGATVPAGAATGRWSVTTPAGTALSATVFSVSAAPVVDDFTPAVGAVGASVVIAGANFTGATGVRFGGVSATVFTVDSGMQISVKVPAGAVSGPVSVTTLQGTGTSAQSFSVVPAPILGSFTPTSGAWGATVTIDGANLAGATVVRFGGIAATFAVDSATRLTATVPPGAVSGPLAVVTPGGTTTSAASFTVVVTPPNDAYAQAEGLSGEAGSTPGNNTAATKEQAEPAHAGNPGGKSLWYRWTAPRDGTWLFDTAGSSFDTVLAIYTGAMLETLVPVGVSDSAVDSSQARAAIVATTGTVYHLAIDGFRPEAGAPADAASGTVVLSWSSTTTAPAISGFAPVTGAAGSTVVIRGANLGGTTWVTVDDVGAAFTVVSGVEIQATVPSGARTGRISVTTPGGRADSAAEFVAIDPPANDAFASALTLAGDAGAVSGSNTDASKEAGEPNHAANPGGRSIWYRWTAPRPGTWVFSTRGSGFDTLLGVYAGATLNSLTEVASSDDTGPGTTSQVVVSTAAGVTYQVGVDGRGGASGTVTLSWAPAVNLPMITGFTPPAGGAGTRVVVTGSNLGGAFAVHFNGVPAVEFGVDSSTQVSATVPGGANSGPIAVATPNGTAVSATGFSVSDAPPNDLFAAAQVLAGPALVVAGRNLGALKEAGEPDHADDPGGRSVWYRWTAPSAGTWAVDTAGSDFDTTLAVYTGDVVTGLALVGANDDARLDRSSRVTFPAAAGAVYRIGVDGYAGESGNLVLKLIPATAPQEVYATGFEAAEGFAPALALAGQGGWLSQGSGGNGLLRDVFAELGQQAYIGFVPPLLGEQLWVWHPLNHVPSLATRPVVRFSVLMAVVDSSNGTYDDFYWTVYRRSGELLFGLDFDNNLLEVFSLVEGAPIWESTGVSFANDEILLLEMSMDFGRNRWNAWLDGAPLVTEAPMSTTSSAVDLGDIDAEWIPLDPLLPGNNLLVFDEYRVTAEASELPVIYLEPASQTILVGSTATLSVVAGGGEPLAYQWRREGDELAGATNAMLVLSGVQPAQQGAYTVVVKNQFGEVTGGPANVAVRAAAPAQLAARGRLANGQFQLTVTGTPGARYVVEASSDLAVWVALPTPADTSGAFLFTDTLAGTQARRYYRVRWVP